MLCVPREPVFNSLAKTIAKNQPSFVSHATALLSAYQKTEIAGRSGTQHVSIGSKKDNTDEQGFLFIAEFSSIADNCPAISFCFGSFIHYFQQGKLKIPFLFPLI